MSLRGALAAFVAAAPLSVLPVWTGDAAGRGSGQSGTVADGVYVREQAERGDKGYALYCASCHAEDLSGTNSGDSGAPPLRREGFMEGSDAGALFTKIRDTMPLDAPASLPDEDYLDILAYIFQQNGFPPGAGALTADPARLRTIRIVRAAPAR